MSAIEISGLRVRRGEKLVLPDLSLAVEKGSVTALLGPSGCGKTTLMRSIVGVQITEGGTVEVLGLPAGARELRSRVAYLTQAPSVYSDLSVHENLRFFARVLRAPHARIEAAVEAVSLGGFEHRVVRGLSGGERARVSLATALLAEPDVLVLDEPTVGLDPLLREDLWKTFYALARRGKTLLVSSHVMDEAVNCDHLALMREGRFLAIAPPGEILKRTGADDLTEAFLRLIRDGAEGTPGIDTGGKRADGGGVRDR